MKTFFAKIWSGWKTFARAFARVQLEIILFVFYFLIYTPFGLIMRLFGFDPLRTRLKSETNWQDADIGRFDKERARHQS